MKFFLKSILCCTILLSVNKLAAASIEEEHCCPDFCAEFSPYVGIEGKLQHTEGKRDWKPILPKGYAGGTLYIGAKLFEVCSLELGFSETFRKEKKYTFKTNDSFFGDTQVAGAQTTIKNHFTNWHLDLNGYYPFAECWELFGSIGGGVVKPKLGIELANIPATDTLLVQIPRNGKGRGVFRLGVGIQYMATESFGLRALVRWESTSRVKIYGPLPPIPAAPPAPPPPPTSFFPITAQKGFSNTYSISAGVFWKFSWI